MISLNFKEWLLKEDVEYLSDMTGDLFIPTTGDEYHYANSDPGDIWWLQWKWDQEKNQGREFIGIDYKKFQKINFISLKSNTMPNDKSWENKPDLRSNLEPVETDLYQIGLDGKKIADKPMVTPATPWMPLPKTFGDNISGNWQQAAKDEKF